VVGGGPQAVSEKPIAKIVSGTERMKNAPIHICSKIAFVG